MPSHSQRARFVILSIQGEVCLGQLHQAPSVLRYAANTCSVQYCTVHLLHSFVPDRAPAQASPAACVGGTLPAHSAVKKAVLRAEQCLTRSFSDISSSSCCRTPAGSPGGCFPLIFLIYLLFWGTFMVLNVCLSYALQAFAWTEFRHLV